MAIVDFILDRVQEDEVLANSALDGRAADDSWTSVSDAGRVDSRSVSDAGHFNQWSPWRVQSACITRRLLVSAHRGMASPDHLTVVCRTCRDGDDATAAWPCYTLRVVASEWSQHPDYRDEWHPIRRAPNHPVGAGAGSHAIGARPQAPGQRGA